MASEGYSVAEAASSDRQPSITGDSSATESQQNKATENGSGDGGSNEGGAPPKATKVSRKRTKTGCLSAIHSFPNNPIQY
jgi:hypothetical protein